MGQAYKAQNPTREYPGDIAKVQEWLGRANIATTPIYDRRKLKTEDSSTFEAISMRDA
jgi:hypothetical protein